MNAIQEQKVNEKFAEKNNLSIDEINMKVQEVYNELDANDFATDDARWARAHRRVRGAFRQKAKSMVNAVDGMIVCRMTNKDFDRNQYDFAMRTIDSQGKDVALSKGLINQDGQPLYQWGDNRGQPILGPDDNPGRPLCSGRAIGYTFEKDEDGEYIDIQPRYIVISKKKNDGTIPVCQIGKLSISISDSSQKGFFADNNFAYYNDASISGVHQTPYDFDEIQEILGQWNRAFGENFAVISNVEELQKFGKEHAFSKDNKDCEYDFCVVPGIVSAIFNNGDDDGGYSKYYNDTVTLEFIDYDTLETTVLNCYIPKEMLKGLAMAPDDQGIFVLQSSSYVNKDGQTQYRWHLGGFLPVDDNVDVEKFFGIEIGEEDV